MTNIYVPAPGNQPPLAVVPLVPSDGAPIQTSGSAVHFAWRTATDPEGDALSYTLEVSPEETFPEDATVSVSGLDRYYIIYDRTLREAWGHSGAADGQYYWRVFAVDEYGAVSPEGQSRAFTLENIANPADAGGVVGRVTDARSGLPIPGAGGGARRQHHPFRSQGEFLFLQIDGSGAT